MKAADQKLARIAARQYGVFTREQASSAGLTRKQIERRIGANAWTPVWHAVYRAASHGPTWESELLVACFAGGPGTVVSHGSALQLWQMPGDVDGSIHVTTSARRWRAPDGVVIHRVGRALVSEERTFVRAIPVTSLARSLFVAAGMTTPDRIEELVDHGLRTGLLSMTALKRESERSNRTRAGVATMRRLIEQRLGLKTFSESALEIRLSRILRSGKIPGLVPQVRVRHRGLVVARADWAIPELKLAIEADSARWHGAPRDIARDAQKRNALTALGWVLLIFTWADLQRPGEVIATVRRVIELRSSGKFAPS